MIATWVFGLWLAWLIGAWSDGWLHAKLVFVLALCRLSRAARRWVRAFAEDRNTRPARFFRMVNELPALFMVAIVILVVVKPF